MNKLMMFLLILAAIVGPVYADSLSVSTPDCSAIIEHSSLGDVFSAPGYSTIASPGDPALLFQDLNVLLPPNADTSSVSVSLESAQIVQQPGSYQVVPAPPMVTVVDGQEIYDWGTSTQILDGKNQLVYSNDSLYPASNVELLSVGNVREWRIARVRYYPYRYNHMSGTLEYTSGGEIKVTYSQLTITTSSLQAKPDPVFSKKIAEFTSNYDEAEKWYSTVSPNLVTDTSGSAPGYAIITTSAIVNGSSKLQAFINHKISRGFNVIVATEAQWGGGTGDKAANSIRSYLKANYQAQGIDYVLLIGNPNPSSGDVPMKMLWPRHNTNSYQEAPSDYYYADLTGIWDKDGDGYFGEADDDFGSGGVDTLPEVIVGRIPFYGSFSELDSILQKTISYESGGIGGSWVKNVLLTAKPSDSSTPGYQLGEAIKSDAVIPAGLSATRVYEQGYGVNPAPEYTPCSYSTVQSAWQKHAGFHFWWTHGNETSAVDVITTGSAGYLDNNYPSFIFQCSCLNAYPERTDNLAYALLKQGAISTDAATRVSWYYPGQTTFTNSDSNSGMTYTYAIKLIRDHLPCGDAHFGMMMDVPNYIWANHCVFNLYGDPSVSYAAGPIIASTPLPDTDVTTGSYPVQAQVTSSVPMASSYPVLKWNTNGSSTFNSIPMSLSNINNYSGSIPAQPSGSTVYYYVQAQDTVGQIAVSPGGAPITLNSFKVEADAQPPVIQHTPLTNTGDTAGPYIVQATITDNRAVAGATVYYNKNGSSSASIAITTQSSDVYEAGIPGGTTIGDVISYYIVATDTSQTKNTTRLPASGYYSFSITSKRRVGVLNSTVLPPYVYGSISNVYQTVEDILNSDPAQRFQVTELTSVSAANLANCDALVFPDNGVSIAEHQYVQNWFTSGKTLLTIDSSACYAAYSGYLWPDAAGTTGYNVLWDSNAGNNDQIIKLADPMTAGYTAGQVIESRGYKTQLFIDKLPADAKILSTSQNNPARAYAVYRDVPGHGRIVVFGPFVPITATQYSLVREALAGGTTSPPTPPPPSNTLTVTYPNGGEGFTADDNITVKWQSSGSWASTDKVKLEYTNGSTWYPVPGAESLAYNADSFSWNTAGLSPAASYKIRVSSADGSISDESDSTFSIAGTPADITLVSPNGGEVYTAGQVIPIQWQSTGTWMPTDMVEMEYSDGTAWYPISGAESIAYSQDSYSWNSAGLPAGNSYKIRVSLVGGVVSDESDAAFVISQSEHNISISSPNGGEVYTAGQVIPIQWQSSGNWASTDKVKLEYTNGYAWYAVPGADSLAYNADSFSWNTTGLSPAASYRVRVSSADGSAYDESNGTFALTQLTKSITIVSPNGGEVYSVGDYIPITWTTYGSWLSTDHIKLEYNNGLNNNWYQITGASLLDYNQGSFSWYTSGLPGSKSYKVRATLVGGTISDESDSAFMIAKIATISQAKNTADRRLVKLVSKVVVSDLDGYSYIEEMTRTAGIRLRNAQGITNSSVVTVIGTMNTVNKERVVDVQSIQVVGTSGIYTPITSTQYICGGPSGLQAGVVEYRTVYGYKRLYTVSGTNNMGLLLKVSGTVTSVGDDYFYINDGGNCDDGTGALGVRVYCGSLIKPAKGNSVTVTAVSSPFYNSNNIFRGLLLPAQSNLVIR